MSNKLSFSKISCYSICGQRYNLMYNEGYKEKWLRASLLFGSSIDQALNELLVSKDLEKAQKIFDKNWNFQYVDNKYSELKTNPNIVYAEKDLDLDLITIDEEQKEWISAFKKNKESKKWDQLEKEGRSKYNSYCWDSMHVKGMIILRDYLEKIIPQFVSVTGIQYKSELTNSDGDSVTQVLDFVATLKDGSVVLFDNKTTSMLSWYKDTSPSMSQQLISYYYNNKEKFNLTAVGFIAIQKTLIKNKTKLCSKCKSDGTDSRARTCDKEFNEERCKGEWDISINPESPIKMIVNPVSEPAIDLVLTTFDQANNGIKNKMWYRNLLVCENIYGAPCMFMDYCWKGSKENLNIVKK